MGTLARNGLSAQELQEVIYIRISTFSLTMVPFNAL